MEAFLNSCRKNLIILDQLKQVYVVLGNEACDLDSTVSTLVTAYLFHKLNLAFGIIVFPVINVSREDLRLRTEVIYFLKKMNIPLDLLICKDEFNFQTLYNDSKLSLILVDHNVLAPSDSFLETSVIRIIDHHLQENVVKDQCDITIESVGSCATLVAEKIFEKLPEILDTQIAMLLYSTIIFDTVCLNESAKRVTNKDIEVASKLESLLKNVNKEEIYQEIQNAKFDVSDLTFDELLRKDLKVISNNITSIAISSLPVLLQTVKNSEGIESILNSFCSKFNYNAIVMMGVNIDVQASEIKRDLGIYSSSSDLQQQMIDFLKNYDDPSLCLEELDFSFPVFNQKNSSASRKFILPILNKFLQYQVASVSSSMFSFPSCQIGSIENSDDLSDFDPLSAENADSNLGSPRYGAGSTNLIGRLGVSGEPLSSQSSSAQNSCPYTPQNSFVEDSFDLDDSLVKQTESLPSFNSREMIEKIEHKRGKLRGYDKDTDVSSIKAIPFTPKNSFSDSSFESYFPQQILAMDSDSFIEKVKKKKASLVGGEEFLNSSGESDEFQADKIFVEETSNGIKHKVKSSLDNENLVENQDHKLIADQNSSLIPIITMTQSDKNEITDH